MAVCTKGSTWRLGRVSDFWIVCQLIWWLGYIPAWRYANTLDCSCAGNMIMVGGVGEDTFG